MSSEHGERRLSLPSEAATAALAGKLAKLAHSGDVLALRGGLGAGKTTFARQFLRALGVTDDVPSPTFSLVQVYAVERGTVWHFDFYRLENAADALELGIEEALDDGICLIEWPDRLGGLLPDARLDLCFTHANSDEERVVTIGFDADWRRRLGGDLADD
jgi:tRNA threonylcarbamoyladenosine biosynthesis protein TsaE